MKKYVFLVTNYEDYLSLVGHGIRNAVSTYFARISDDQLALLQKHFSVLLPFVDSNVNFNQCNLFAHKNNMFSEYVNLGAAKTVSDFLKNGGYSVLEQINDKYDDIKL